MIWLGLVGLVVLGAVAQVHLRRTSDDVEYQLSAGQRRARSSPDGGYVGSNTAGLIAAQRKRQRRQARNLKNAGRGGIHRLDTLVSPRHRPRWWRRRRPAERRR